MEPIFILVIAIVFAISGCVLWVLDENKKYSIIAYALSIVSLILAINISAPSIYPVDGQVSKDGIVEIKTDTWGAEIYYTLDAYADPKEHGTLYSGPICLDAPTTVLARSRFFGIWSSINAVEMKINTQESGQYDDTVEFDQGVGNNHDADVMANEAPQAQDARLIFPISVADAAQYSKKLDTGCGHTVGLKSDGTVVAAGYNQYGQYDVGRWTDIVAVSAGRWHTVGLKADGTVLATGLNDDGQCDVGRWTDIVAVSAGGWHTVGFKSDGTVSATGDNNDGQCNVGLWTDIAAMSAGWNHTVGLKSDGTVVATGDNRYGQCNVGHWSDIVAVSAGWKHTVGLKSDGTVVATGDNNKGQCNVGHWTDIVAVSAGGWHTVGLKSDGTVVATGYNEYGQCDVGRLTDIVAVSAGLVHTVGLIADGTVQATGYNDDGQCDVSGWRLWD